MFEKFEFASNSACLILSRTERTANKIKKKGLTYNLAKKVIYSHLKCSDCSRVSLREDFLFPKVRLGKK